MKNPYTLQSCIQTEYRKVHYCGLNIDLFISVTVIYCGFTAQVGGQTLCESLVYKCSAPHYIT